MSLQTHIKDQQTQCFKAHGVFFAFSNKQFDEQKQEGVKYVSLGAGTICPEPNVKAFIEDHAGIVKKGIAQDIADNGKQAIIQRELENHECFYTGDYEDCVEAVEDYGFTAEDVAAVFHNQ